MFGKGVWGIALAIPIVTFGPAIGQELPDSIAISEPGDADLECFQLLVEIGRAEDLAYQAQQRLAELYAEQQAGADAVGAISGFGGFFGGVAGNAIGAQNEEEIARVSQLEQDAYARSAVLTDIYNGKGCGEPQYTTETDAGQPPSDGEPVPVMSLQEALAISQGQGNESYGPSSIEIDPGVEEILSGRWTNIADGSKRVATLSPAELTAYRACMGPLGEEPQLYTIDPMEGLGIAPASRPDERFFYRKVTLVERDGAEFLELYLDGASPRPSYTYRLNDARDVMTEADGFTDYEQVKCSG